MSFKHSGLIGLVMLSVLFTMHITSHTEASKPKLNPLQGIYIYEHPFNLLTGDDFETQSGTDCLQYQINNKGLAEIKMFVIGHNAHMCYFDGIENKRDGNTIWFNPASDEALTPSTEETPDISKCLLKMTVTTDKINTKDTINMDCSTVCGANIYLDDLTFQRNHKRPITKKNTEKCFPEY